MTAQEMDELRARIRRIAGQLLRTLGPAIANHLSPDEQHELRLIRPDVWKGLAFLVSSWPYADSTRPLLGEWGDKLQPVYGAIAPIMRSHLLRALTSVVSDRPLQAASKLATTLRAIGIPLLSVIGQYDSTGRLASAMIDRFAPPQRLPDYEG